jgi:predicted MFS family arabinose efflux permease
MAAFGSAISFRVTDPLLPLLASEFSVSLGEASNVVTFFSVAYGLALFLFGSLGERHGKYLVVAWASLACAMAAMCCALAPNFPLLLVGRLLSGASAAALIPLSISWIGDVVPYQQRQPVLARFLIGQIIGLSAGALVGGLAADLRDWRMPFYGIALVFLLIGAGLLLLNRRLPAHARVVRGAEGAAARRMLGELVEVLGRRWARLVLLTAFLEGAFVFGAFAFIPTHLHHSYGISLMAAGALVMLFGLGGLLFALASEPLVRRFGQGGLSLWGGTLAALALLAMSVAPLWWWAVPGCLVAGLGFYMLHNTLQTNATQMTPEHRGTAVAVYATCFFLGQSAGVGAAGLMVAYTGTAAVILTGAIGLLIVALNFNRGLRSRP